MSNHPAPLPDVRAPRRDPALPFRDTDPEINLDEELPGQAAPRRDRDTLPSMPPPASANSTTDDDRVVELRVRIQPETGAADRSGDVLEAVLQCLRQYGWRPTFVAMGPTDGRTNAK